MGLFSSKKKTIVGTVVSRVIKDASLPNAVKTGVTKAIIGDEDLPDNVMEEILGCVGIKAERMYEYARTQYTHGVPSSQILSVMEGQQEVTAVLATIEGTVPANISLTYSQYGPPNYLHIGWLKLMADHGYNPATNQLAGLTATKGTTVWLHDMVVVVPSVNAYEAGALDQWGIPATAGPTGVRQYTAGVGELREPTPVAVDPAAPAPYIRVDYTWMGTGFVDMGGYMHSIPEAKYDSFTISTAGYNEAADYFHAKYEFNGAIKYWMYQDDSGTYPTLDAVFIQQQQVNGTFFPFAYFRYNKTSEIADKTTQAYLTSKKLVKYLGMDYDQVATAIDENPDITDVEQAMLVMAVPANTTHELERRYLFSFFENLFYTDANQYSSRAVAQISNSGYTSSALVDRASLVIQDARFKMVLSNSGIYKRQVIGSIGAVGSHSSLVDTIYVPQEYIANMDTMEMAIRDIPIKVHVYRKQVTPHLYDEIRVVNLKVLYYVWQEYAVTADELDDILLIPLDHSITSTYSIPEREELYARSLHYVFNSRVVITIKWYQQDWFQFVMVVVGVALAMYGFQDLAAQLIGALAGSGAVTVSAALQALLMQLLKGVLLGLAFKAFVKAVGGELALALAVIATVAALGIQNFDIGGVSGAPWAQDLLRLATGLTRGVQEYYTEELKGLASDYQAQLDWQKEATEELNSAKKLLENNNYLSPFVIFGESPNEFYNRTVHSGNIGVLSISAISHYVDTALRLPRLDDTIGESHVI